MSIAAEPRSSTALDLVPVRVLALYPPVQPEAALYIREASQNSYRLYAARGIVPTVAELDQLLQRQCNVLYASPEDAAGLREQLRELVCSGINMPAAVRLEVAREVMRDDMARDWKVPGCDPLVKQAAQFSAHVVDVCSNHDDLAGMLASLAAHDGDTFTHISNVCTYSVMLAQAMGEQKKAALLEIGQAALLHDLGKRSIAPDILKKPGPLNAAEREVMSGHPRIGFEEVCHRADLSRDQLLMIYQHHEKLDGTGYPVGLVGSEINWSGKLCAVVDVFDALTARRSYRQPARPVQALEFLELSSGSHFSPEFVQGWSAVVHGM